MAIAEDEGPRRKEPWEDPNSPEYDPTMAPGWLPEGDARLDFGLDGRAAMFPDWLVVMAPLHARAFARYDSPLWNAIFDMRAAALKGAQRDCPSDVWCVNEQGRAFDDLSDILWNHGIVLPRRLFDVVWEMYLNFLAGPGQEPHELSPDSEPWGDGEWLLLGAAARVCAFSMPGRYGSKEEYSIVATARQQSRLRYGRWAED